MATKRKTVNSTDAAQMLSVSRRTFVRIANKEGLIPAQRANNLRAYYLTDVKKLVSAQNKRLNEGIDKIVSQIESFF